MKRICRRVLLMLLASLTVLICTLTPTQAQNNPALTAQGLQLEQVGTRQVYFSYNGAPLLSFGGAIGLYLLCSSRCF